MNAGFFLEIRLSDSFAMDDDASFVLSFSTIALPSFLRLDNLAGLSFLSRL
jgi:hypothetical protein